MASSFAGRTSLFISSNSFLFLPYQGPCWGVQKFSYKILLPPAGSSFSSVKVFTIVLGGTAALHVHRAWGAVIFCRRKVWPLTLAHALAQLEFDRQKTPNAQRPTPNVEISNREPNIMAPRFYTDHAADRRGGVDHFFTCRDLAGSHSAAKQR